MNIRILILLTIICFSASGCFVLLVGGAGAYVGTQYVNGVLFYDVRHPVSQVHEASLMALRDLDLLIMDDDISQREALVKFEYDDGKWGRIQIKAITEKVSSVKIRIGTLGNEEKATAVRKALGKYLEEIERVD